MLPNMDDTASSEKELWKSLQLYSIYRFILATACLILAYQNTMTPIFGQYTSYFVQGNAQLFLQTSLNYLAFAVLMLMLGILQKPSFSLQANLGIYCDIPFLLIIMHACGGILSGMGLLFIIVAAAHSILSPGKLSFFSAALISIGILLEYFYSAAFGDNLFRASSQVGLLGAIIFATSLLTNFLALKALKHQSIIHKQAIQLDSSYQLNSIIVNLIQQGVIVLDEMQKIKLINVAALNLLSFKRKNKPDTLEDLPQPFQNAIFAWIINKKIISPIQMTPLFPKVRLEFLTLGADSQSALLIFLYDIKTEMQKAQDLKLSSLGHLTANIAHELRNPLGAASHAAQLLQESQSLNDEDLALTKMIHANCDRMNQVIRNVLSLSCQKSNAKKIELNRWIRENITYIKFPQYPNAKIDFNPSAKESWILVDPSHLMQIIINLCENGLRYSEKKSGQPTITLQTRLGNQPNGIYLDVIDQGDGVPEDAQEFIFEPFFTTEKAGTGLGLYLARELSQINGAYLDYQKGPMGSQFRIIFSQECHV